MNFTFGVWVNIESSKFQIENSNLWKQQLWLTSFTSAICSCMHACSLFWLGSTTDCVSTYNKKGGAGLIKVFWHLNTSVRFDVSDLNWEIIKLPLLEFDVNLQTLLFHGKKNSLKCCNKSLDDWIIFFQSFFGSKFDRSSGKKLKSLQSIHCLHKCKIYNLTTCFSAIFMHTFLYQVLKKAQLFVEKIFSLEWFTKQKKF